MANLTLELPEDLRSKLERRAAQTGHRSLEQYVEALLRCEIDAVDAEDQDYGAPAHLTIQSAEHLEALLEEGEKSGPPTEVGPNFWAELRAEAEAQLAARQKSSQPK